MYQQAQELRNQAEAEREIAEELYDQIEATAEKLEDAARRAARFLLVCFGGGGT